MSSGKPDWYTSAVLTGKYGINFLPVAVDSEGNIKAILQGSSIITGDVNATDQNTIKQIQGTDGATYRTIAVDSLGQLIAVMKSAAGNNVVVDASGFLSAILKGTYAAAGDKNIAVDADGRLMAMVKALYGSTVKDVQTDTNGNLTLNLKAQDIAEMIIRLKYGSANSYSGSGTIPPNTWQTIYSVAAKGALYGGTLKLNGIAFALLCDLNLLFDGVKFNYWYADAFVKYNLTPTINLPITLIHWDPINWVSVFAFGFGHTFETSLEFKIRNAHGTESLGYDIDLYYSII